MWKLLIAEDEIEILDGLRNYVQWDKMGIEMVAAVTDGKKALEYVENNPVDILLTDIEMPYLTGLELIEMLIKKKSDVIPVIISAHDDVDYFKTAFKLEVIDYILKPIDLSELDNTMGKIVEKCSKIKKRKEEMQKIEDRIKEMGPILKERLMYKLISGAVYNEDVVKNNISQLQLKIQPQDNCIFLALRSLESVKENVDGCVLEVFLQEILTTLSNSIEYYMITVNSDAGVALIGERCIESEFVQKIINDITKKLYEIGMKVVVGVGMPQSSIFDMYYSRQQAEKALDFAFVLNANDAIFYTDLMKSGVQPIHPDNIIIDIADKISIGDAAAVNEKLNVMFTRMIARYGEDTSVIKSICYNLLGRLDKSLDGKEVIRHQLFKEQMKSTEDVLKLRKMISEYCNDITLRENKHHEEKFHRLIHEIIQYINLNYDNNITLKRLSEQFYFSPNYISALFKRYEDTTFTQYITQVRIEHSKELMKNVNLKLYQIAKAVGYKDADYFSKKFKHITGYSPSEWRDNRKF